MDGWTVLWYLLDTMAKPTAPIPNPGYEGTVKVLIEAGYQCSSQFKRDAASSRGLILPETHFEIWVGPKGCLIVQVWTKGNGCNVYADWVLGHRLDELKAAISNPSVS